MASARPPAARQMFAGLVLALATAAAIVALWLVPALLGGDRNYQTELLWTQSAGMVNLEDLIDPLAGWSDLSEARGINDSGQIVGYGTHNGQQRAFLMTLIPEDNTGNVPEPGTLALAPLLDQASPALDPAPTTLSTLTAAPMASPRCFTMARPRPVPPSARERDVSTR